MSNTNAILAKFMGRNPTHGDFDRDRNDLAEVLLKAWPTHGNSIVLHLFRDHEVTTSGINDRISRVHTDDIMRLLTCDPAIIAEAVARVVGEVSQ